MKHTGLALMAWMFIAGGVALGAEGPSAVLRDAPLLKFPAETDSNSPVHWDGDTFYLFNSVGKPKRSIGPGSVPPRQADRLPLQQYNVNGGRWIECTWKAEDGTLYAWYHHEPVGLCPVHDAHGPERSARSARRTMGRRLKTWGS